MIRRVLKDIRETWLCWSILILAGLFLAAYIRSNPSISNALNSQSTSIEAKNQFLTVCSQFAEMKARTVPLLDFLTYLGFNLIAVALFGSEFRHHTMGYLLAQPISRWRIWWEKNLAFFLIVAGVLIGQALTVVWAFVSMENQFLTAASRSGFVLSQGYQDAVGFSVVTWGVLSIALSALALSSATLASLFLRQTHTAFWAALILPPATFLLCMLADWVLFGLLFSFSVGDWLLSQMPSIHLGWMDCGALFALCVFWSLIVHPLAWLKFKKLEV